MAAPASGRAHCAGREEELSLWSSPPENTTGQVTTHASCWSCSAQPALGSLLRVPAARLLLLLARRRPGCRPVLDNVVHPPQPLPPPALPRHLRRRGAHCLAACRRRTFTSCSDLSAEMSCGVSRMNCMSLCSEGQGRAGERRQEGGVGHMAASQRQPEGGARASSKSEPRSSRDGLLPRRPRGSAAAGPGALPSANLMSVSKLILRFTASMNTSLRGGGGGGEGRGRGRGEGVRQQRARRGRVPKPGASRRNNCRRLRGKGARHSSMARKGPSAFSASERTNASCTKERSPPDRLFRSSTFPPLRPENCTMSSRRSFSNCTRRRPLWLRAPRRELKRLEMVRRVSLRHSMMRR